MTAPTPAESRFTAACALSSAALTLSRAAAITPHDATSGNISERVAVKAATEALQALGYEVVTRDQARLIGREQDRPLWAASVEAEKVPAE